MKIPRQSFAEAACLYQNDGGKAMVISNGVRTVRDRKTCK